MPTTIRSHADRMPMRTMPKIFNNPIDVQPTSTTQLTRNQQQQQPFVVLSYLDPGSYILPSSSPSFWVASNLQQQQPSHQSSQQHHHHHHCQDRRHIISTIIQPSTCHRPLSFILLWSCNMRDSAGRTSFFIDPS